MVAHIELPLLFEASNPTGMDSASSKSFFLRLPRFLETHRFEGRVAQDMAFYIYGQKGV